MPRLHHLKQELQLRLLGFNELKIFLLYGREKDILYALVLWWFHYRVREEISNNAIEEY